MSVQTELIAAVEADPEDPAPQLVLADWLLSIGDPRGELIVLDHRDRSTPGGVTDPDAIERLLLLSAEYSFPYAPDRPEPVLPFVRRGQHPLHYELDHEGRHYVVRYAEHLLAVTCPGDGLDGPRNGYWMLDTSDPDRWTDEEARTILMLLGDAIRADAPLNQLLLPYIEEPLPRYEGGPLRGYQLPVLFVEMCRVSPKRYGLAARDYHRWHALWARFLNARPHHW